MAKLTVLPNDGGKRYGLPGSDEEIVFKVRGEETDGLFDYYDIRSGYLGGPPLHLHLEQHETFHVLDGEFRVRVGDEEMDLRRGDHILIPRGVAHSYVNLKQERARMVGVLSPGGFPRFLDELLAYVASVHGQIDRAKYDEICARHHQQFVGPPMAVTMGLKKGPGG
jgi:mannose-6-phosphate isomerase-like protein (cupin superfamily)